MKTDSGCDLCHKVFAIDENRHPFGDQTICSACLQIESEHGNICPACKIVLNPDMEEIGLVLTKSEAPHRKILAEPTSMVIICPHCRILYFDAFQYEILRGFKDAGARLAVK